MSSLCLLSVSLRTCISPRRAESSIPAVRWLHIALILPLLVAPASAYAWGATGHQIIAEIAFIRLEPGPRRAVLELLDGRLMREEAVWADHVRGQAEWEWLRQTHYINDLDEDGRMERDDDCPEGQCVVALIEEQAERLKSAGSSRNERLLALRLILHMVGDVHQPLHAARANDRGGNEIDVIFRGRQMNLHSLWDTALVHALAQNSNPAACARALAEVQDGGADWEVTLDPLVWAQESYQLAQDVAYDVVPGQPLTASYETLALAVVTTQLIKAGYRLSAILNTVLQPE